MKWIKENCHFVLLGLVLAVAFFLHFRNLNGVVFLDEDEARGFNLLSSGQMLYLLCHPFFKLTLTQSSAFYVAAFLGWVNIILFYSLCRVMRLSKLTVIFSVLIYAFWPLRIDYARTLYPAVFVEFFFLLSFLTAALSVSRSNLYLGFASGCFALMMFLSHYSAYSLCLGVLFFIWLYYYAYHKPNNIQTRRLLVLLFIFGFILSYFISEVFLGFLRKDYILSQQLISFLKGDISAMKFIYHSDLFLNLRSIFAKFDLFRVGCLLLVLASGYIVYRKKNQVFTLLPVPYLISFVSLLVFSLVGMHTFKMRNMVWLISLFSVILGMIAGASFKTASKKIRMLIIVIFSAVCFWMLFTSYCITVETFKNTQINSWLKKNNINKKFVATWWDLYVPGESDSVSLLPVVMVNTWRTPDEIWYYGGRHYRIYWPLIVQAYQLGFCKYIITSGPSEHMDVGRADKILKTVKPLVSWPHPYSLAKHRFFYKKHNLCQINVYSLEDVFKGLF